MKKYIRVHQFIFLMVGVFCLITQSVAQDLTIREIMAEPSIAGMRVEGEKLSPDGQKVIYLWNAEGKLPRDLYLVPTSGGPAQIVLRTSDLPAPTRSPEKENKLDYGLTIRDEFVRSRENQLGNFEWSPDSKKVVFSHGGDLYTFTLESKTIKRFTKTQAPESGVRFLDNDRIIYSQSGNIFVLDTADASITQISKEANPATFISVSGGIASKNAALVAYTVSDSSKQQVLVFPNYLGEFVAAPTTRRGWSDQRIFVTPSDGSRDTPFEIKLPKSEGVANIRRMAWAADNRSLIIDRVDKDTKRRQLYYVRNVGSKDEEIMLVTEETDEKWQAPLSAIFEPNPKDANQLFFCSEKDGFNHIYLATLTPQAETRAVTSVLDPNARVAEGSPGMSGKVVITQLTKGDWQVEWAKWKAGSHIILMSTQASYTERHFYVLWKETARLDRFPVSGSEMKSSPQINDDDESVLLYESSRWNAPSEIYSRSICPECAGLFQLPKKLSQTTPEKFSAIHWATPAFTEIPSRDGKKIPAKIYLPAGHSTKKKYPMVVFIHGAGYLQNVINGWNNYYREFMFNQMLTQKGYVVLDIDYRGSAGYGRDWRTDVYDFLGGKDMDDHVDSIDFMAANYGVDAKKVGVYGGSYGGFMAGMLATRAPDKVAAAAALRPVFDWKNYYASSPGYTAQRLGFPDKNPEAYKRSSPITYADKLERPLLILHGMSDDNVPVQDSVQMIEKLIRLGKTQYFETMLYPSENHGFVRPESWTDEYERIFAFFEKHLK